MSGKRETFVSIIELAPLSFSTSVSRQVQSAVNLKAMSSLGARLGGGREEDEA